jgi:hypothetical protein
MTMPMWLLQMVMVPLLHMMVLPLQMINSNRR